MGGSSATWAAAGAGMCWVARDSLPRTAQLGIELLKPMPAPGCRASAVRWCWRPAARVQQRRRARTGWGRGTWRWGQVKAVGVQWDQCSWCEAGLFSTVLLSAAHESGRQAAAPSNRRRPALHPPGKGALLGRGVADAGGAGAQELAISAQLVVRGGARGTARGGLDGEGGRGCHQVEREAGDRRAGGNAGDGGGLGGGRSNERRQQQQGGPAGGRAGKGSGVEATNGKSPAGPQRLRRPGPHLIAARGLWAGRRSAAPGAGREARRSRRPRCSAQPPGL